MTGRQARLAGVAGGLLLDRAVGEPPAAVHPVALFGQAMGAVERRWWKDCRRAGVVYAALGIGSGALAGAATSRLSRRAPAAAVAAATGVVVAGRLLGGEARRIGAALAAGDLAAARERLPALAGRDPELLDEAGVARAVVESIAENTVDAVIAPACWAAVLGAPGAGAYRATNTLDAMVGHRNERYQNFGWAAARADDVANWVPARLTVVLVALVRPRAAAGALRAITQPPAVPSPNAAVAEAAFAAALGVRLGGDVAYAGRVDPRPSFGGARPPGPADIEAAVRLSRDVTLALAGLLAAPAAARRLRWCRQDGGPAR